MIIILLPSPSGDTTPRLSCPERETGEALLSCCPNAQLSYQLKAAPKATTFVGWGRVGLDTVETDTCTPSGQDLKSQQSITKTKQGEKKKKKGVKNKVRNINTAHVSYTHQV